MSNHVTSSLHIHAPGATPPDQDLKHNENGTNTGAGEKDMNEPKKEGMHL